MIHSDSHTDCTLTIEGIEEPVINNYFTTINKQQFEQTAALFAATGELLPPFTKAIKGRKEIASYLSQEAIGMTLLPQQGIYKPTEEHDLTQIQLTGKVKTALFSVNVSWFFSLNPQQQITTAKIKLLASPQDLLELRAKQNK